jgi:ribosomal protein S19
MFRGIYLDKRMKNKLFIGEKISDLKGRVVKDNLKSKIVKSYDVSLRSAFYSPRTLIARALVGERIYFQTGKGINSIKVTENMVGFKVSEYSISRKNNQRKK